MDPLAKYQETRTKLFQKAGIAPQSKFITTEGPVKKVHYLELGEGKPLIIVHGGGSHASSWINILKPLAEHFRLFVVDRPGHGLTDAFNYRRVPFRESAVDFVRSFMDATGLDKAALMGNSMGGYFSMCFAMDHPQRVEKLILIGAPAGMDLWIPLMLRLLGTRYLNGFLLKTIAKPSVPGVKNMYKQLLVADVDKLSDEYLAHDYYHQLLPGTMEGFTTLLENALTLKGWRKDLYIGNKLDQLNIPVRFIWGDKDVFEKPETGKQKARNIKDHKFEVVQNAGHLPWLDQPERCAKLIISMLKEST